MKIKYIIFLAVLLVISIQSTFATIDYLVVNHVTKQLYWAQTDHPPGWIGWEGLGEVYEPKEKEYLLMGYTYTDNPYVIDRFILLLVVLIIVIYWLIRRRKTSKVLKELNND